MMRVGVTSDIHTDISPANERIIRYIADEARDAELDAFVICGDISPDIMKLSRTLSAFHDVESEKLFVAGNHDIWLVGLNSSVTSHDKYFLITAICKEHGFHHLGDSPVILGQVGFCGTIGWYDYSYKRDEYPISEKAYIRKTFAGSVWNDVNYARWEDSDPKMARQFEEELQGQIDSIRDRVSQIIVVTHHVPFRECVIYRGELPWDFFSAFMGSVGLGEICINEPLVTHAFFGHTHTEFLKEVKGIQAVCSPIGYLTDPPRDLRKYARERLRIVELPESLPL
jgi:putative phosphoesterase